MQPTNWRPLILCSLLVAQKVWDDRYLSNADFAFIYPFFVTAEINKLEKKFRKLITNAANKNIGKKKISNNTKPWMTTKIKDSIKVRNELRKTVQQNRGEWIQACRNTADLISNRKKETWKEYVESISATSSSAQIWKTIRSMDGRRPPERGNEILEVDRLAISLSIQSQKTLSEFERQRE